MPAGVEIVVEDGFATVTPNREQRGHVLRALLAAVDHPSQVRTDTSGPRRAYVVLEQDARKAGLIDEKPARAPRVKRNPRKSPVTTPEHADTEPPVEPTDETDPTLGR